MPRQFRYHWVIHLGIRSSSFVRGGVVLECGYFGHIARYCPRLLGGTPQRSTRPTAPVPVPPPPVQPARGGVQPARGRAQSDMGRPRGGGRSGGGQARFYALPAMPDAIASYAMISDPGELERSDR
nr:uncharacterized protein LOC117279023 [Nicotiana tomentosiformis]